MKGRIRHINSQRGMVAVLTEDGSYSIFEVLGGDTFELGDVVSWEGSTPLGSAELANHTQDERCDVYFQNHHVHATQLRQQLLID